MFDVLAAQIKLKCDKFNIVDGHVSLPLAPLDHQTLTRCVTARMDPSITFDNRKTNINVHRGWQSAVFTNFIDKTLGDSVKSDLLRLLGQVLSF